MVSDLPLHSGSIVIVVFQMYFLRNFWKMLFDKIWKFYYLTIREASKEGTNEGGGGGKEGREGELRFHVNQTRQLNGSTRAQIEDLCVYWNLKREENQSYVLFLLPPARTLASEFITMVAVLVAS